MLAKYFLTAQGHAGEHAAALAQLDLLLESKPERLVVVIVGSGLMASDAALAYIDLLASATSDIAICSYANLIGPTFALWLTASDVREIRPNAWAYVPRNSSIAEASREGSVVTLTAEATFSGPDYAKCLDLIAQHIELETCFERLLRPPELREWNLVAIDHLAEMAMREPSPEPRRFPTHER